MRQCSSPTHTHSRRVGKTKKVLFPFLAALGGPLRMEGHSLYNTAVLILVTVDGLQGSTNRLKHECRFAG